MQPLDKTGQYRRDMINCLPASLIHFTLPRLKKGDCRKRGLAQSLQHRVIEEEMKIGQTEAVREIPVQC